ncbi:MAG: hypothetical protein SVP26_06590 [Chloroflexota bacterium]|nr:hypothetical protein [Chloroflexota bacterium]
MKRYLKVGAIALLAIAIIGVMAGSAVAFADSSEGDADATEGPRQVFVTKVADILGLETEQVANAFQQAHQEMFQEGQQMRLQKALQEGLITEDEASEIQDWWQQQPEALQKLGPVNRCPGGHMWGVR